MDVPPPTNERTLPVLDMSGLLEGPVSRENEKVMAFVGSLDDAAKKHGFFYLVGHGLSEGELEEPHLLARDLFRRPREDLEGIGMAKQPETFRGFQNLGDNVTLGKRDRHSALDLWEEVETAEMEEGMKGEAVRFMKTGIVGKMKPFITGKNLWPSEDFKERTEAYVEKVKKVGMLLMSATALCFGLPPETFDKSLDPRGFWGLRFIHYPPRGAGGAANGISRGQPATRESASSSMQLRGSEGAEGGVKGEKETGGAGASGDKAGGEGGDGEEFGHGVGAHTDYGFLTLVNQDDTPGALEVFLDPSNEGRGHSGTEGERKGGRWLPVDPLKGALVVNIGDMLAVLTNLRWKSTLHRVDNKTGRERTSIPFFCEPNVFTVVKPIVTEGGAGDGGGGPIDSEACTFNLAGGVKVPVSEGIVYGEWVCSKVAGNFDFGGM
uniref:Uncharacterized protein n=1 Tax=Chromera velia CCMP2878 TaxID=1169474 RepID=A0A0G4FB20_9ALVE|eukprot:Cvel_16100.t1-p1 / transcript=Cvel_16100.t1 / gene=Cvel_16100 / organism=Chromera_velia_CCMP2878 / gene_product=Probable iron/ascorbate oxidoreductase DDB_G0283291, putative / transcript_product=Probable iron/ascorbate oxidoreductase DDB_G0283291, putative / location=Cvel_scaffold1225:10579-15688(-) / protein_length=436 / sequence_SO=supercontig / SO=protein_coding / is_pseudo=false